jgi:osmotically inducible protein OsmC
MKRKANAVWTGSGKSGSGTLNSESTVLSNTAYSFNTRFGEGKGTNPEELIAAAHAGCFSMALAFALGEAGHEPTEIKTEATVTVEKQDAGFAITAVHLDLAATIPGISEDEFRKVAEGAKKGCPVSKVLNAEITLDARLNG